MRVLPERNSLHLETKEGKASAFIVWSREEIGIIGSYAEHAKVALKQIAAYVNFDMVGRLRDNKLSLQGVGSSKVGEAARETQCRCRLQPRVTGRSVSADRQHGLLPKEFRS